jgi:hypothetical protein
MHKLSVEDKLWLDKFNRIYYQDYIKLDEDIDYLEVPPSEGRTEIGESPTPTEHRRWLGRRNNKRHRDIWAQNVKFTFNTWQHELDAIDPEEDMIKLIDSGHYEWLYTTYVRLPNLTLVEDEDD